MAGTLMVERDQAVSWLLKQDNPSIRYWTLRDLLGRSDNDPDVAAARDGVASSGPVAEYLKEQHPDGYWGFPEDVYWPKWRATVWPLILLAELGLPGKNPSIRAGCEYFLKVMGDQDRSWPPPKYPDEDLRGWRLVWEPCVTGNMARTLAVFGYGDDPRVREMFEWLVKYQRDDGGWNCETEDGRDGEAVHHSSFMSTIEPLWAFSPLDPQHWSKGGREAVERGCEFLLMHRLFKSDKTGKVIREEWPTCISPCSTSMTSSTGYEWSPSSALEVMKGQRMPETFSCRNGCRMGPGPWKRASCALCGETS